MDQEKLIKLILSWEERVSINQFTHYASNCPEVDLFAIIATHQELCRSIPPGSYVICHSFLFFLDLPGKTEITYFESVILTDKEVFWLDVPMDDVKSMEIDESFEELIYEGANDRKFDAIGRFLQNF